MKKRKHLNDNPEQEIILYYEGEDQLIPGGKNLYTYFDQKGYRVIPNAPANLLIQAMMDLTEEKLAQLDIPKNAAIVLPTDKDSLLPGPNDVFLVFWKLIVFVVDVNLVSKILVVNGITFTLFFFKKRF